MRKVRFKSELQVSAEMTVRPHASDPDSEITYIDDILDKFSITGSYYVRIWPLLFLAYVSNSVYVSNYVFTAEYTGFRCKDERFGLNTCTSLNDSDLVCKEWIYDDPNTFMAEFQLACNEWKRILVGTAHSFGYMIGLLAVGPLSDRLGRKTTLAVTGLFGGILGISRSFTTSYWTFITLEVLEAAIGDVGSPLYILTIEMVSNDKRVLFQLLCGIGYSVGFLVLPLFAWITPNWRYLLRVIYAPAILLMLYVFILDESPRWLLTKGYKEEAVQILKKMAKTDKIELDDRSLENLSHVKDNEIPFIELLTDTVTSSILLKRVMICIIWWTVSCFVNYGLLINSVSLHGNKYVDFALIAVIEAVGHTSVYFLLKRYRRRKPLMYAFILAAVLCLPQAFVPDYLNWLGVILYICGKLMSSIYFYITYMYTCELFPTCTRNSMHALCSSIGRIGSMVAPQTPLLVTYWDGLPTLVFSAASLLAGLVTISAPDTADEALPDTVLEAEEREKPAIRTGVSRAGSNIVVPRISVQCVDCSDTAF